MSAGSALRAEGELELVELLGRDGRGAAGHDVATAVVLGEGDEVADAVDTAEEGAETVEAEGETGMWRRAVGEGVHEEAELCGGTLVGEAEGVEHLVLERAVVDTDAATTDFDTVDDDVVGVGADVAPAVGLVEERLVLGLGRGEGVVHGVVALRLLVPLEEREVDDPQGGVDIGVAETQLAAHLETEGGELHAGFHSRAAEDEHEVARVGTELIGDGTKLVGGVELVDTGLEGAVGVVLDVDEAAGANLGTLDEVGEGVELLAGVFGAARSADADDELGIVEEGEAATFGDIAQFDELHTETDVGFVAAVEAHGVVPGDAGELVEVEPFDLVEEVFCQTFEGLEDILLMDEGHLAVDLCELGLAVGAEVLIAEAADNLEVAVHAGDHEELFVLLRALREGVELAGVHAGGDDEVARAFGGGLDEHGGLDFEEVEIAEVVADEHGHAVAELEIAADGVATDVEVAVAHTEVVAAIAVVLDGEGGSLGLVEDGEFTDIDFDVAGGELGIFRGTLDDDASDLKDVFAPEAAGLLTESGVGFHVEGELGDAIAVAEVDEGHASEVAAALEPATKGDLLAEVFDG